MALARFRTFSQSPDDPLRDVTDIQGQMNRLLDSFWGRPSPLAGLARAWAPAVDMYESKDELVIAAELPGLIHPGSAAAAA
jgi:HSP20 family molecular chaperone IbpA